jgi:RHS repeat-associated protein
MKKFQAIVMLICICRYGLQAQNINHPNIACPLGLNVNSYNGNLYLERKDIYIEGRKLPINLTFYYNSTADSINLGYGKGWSMEYLMRYEAIAGGIRITKGDAYQMDFKQLPSNGFKAPTSVFDSLAQYQPGKFVLITKQKMKYFFDDVSHKRLTRKEEINGNYLNFTYAAGLVTQVMDATGRAIQLSYTAGLLTEITDALNTPIRKTSYTYDNYGNLTEAADPLGNKFKYAYNINGPLRKLTDKNGNVANIIYNAAKSVKEVITCITNQRFSYNKNVSQVVELVSGQNQITTYRYNSKGYITEKQGNCCGFNTRYEYDNDGNISKFTDANGHIYTLTYDNHGNMLSQTDPLNYSEYYAYDPVFNNITSYTDKNGNTTTFGYDTKGNRTLISYPLGITNSFTYASNGDRLSFTNGRSFTTTYSYDAYGNIISENRPLGATTKYIYDARSRLITKTDALNHATTYNYDLLDRITSIIDALNNTTKYTFDAHGNTVSKTDALNHSFTYSYDALNRNVMITNALGKNKTFTYNAKNNLISSTDENGNTTQSVYDNLNRLISQSNALNETINYSYDHGTNITSINYPNGNTENFTYDPLNRRLSSVDVIGTISNQTYDRVGNELTRIDGNGNTVSYSYDALHRKVSVTDAFGKSKTFSYDGNANLISRVDRNSHQHHYSYDALDRKISETDPLNYVTAYKYDLVGNQTSITDANNNTTNFTYDALNRKTGEIYPAGTPNTYTYGATGNLATKTDGKGTTHYIYDQMNRLTVKDYPTSSNDTFSYDNSGRMLAAINSDATVLFTYNAANRLISETLNGKTTEHVYDIGGKKRILHYPGGRIINEQYDERNRLVTISENNTEIANFAFDAGDRNIGISYSNGTNTSIIYDADDRIVSMLSNPSGFQHFEYIYDNEGNALAKKSNSHPAFSEQYQYDNADRLINFKKGIFAGTVIPNPTTQTQYNYDGLGNRNTINVDGSVISYTANNLNQYTSIFGTSNINPTHDLNGNLTYDGTYNFSYTDENRLVNVNNGSIAKYKYDALGRRIQKKLISQTLIYYYAGQNLIEEYNINDSLQASYVYGDRIDNIITMRRSINIYFYHKDALGSITSITGNTGAIVERYDYDVFGKSSIYNKSNVLIATSLIENSFMFTSRESNAETDNYYYRARSYNFGIGKFLQRDPLGYDEGPNFYTYTKNNPVNFSDPTGLSAYDDCKASCKPTEQLINTFCQLYTLPGCVDELHNGLPRKLYDIPGFLLGNCFSKKNACINNVKKCNDMKYERAQCIVKCLKEVEQKEQDRQRKKQKEKMECIERGWNWWWDGNKCKPHFEE